MRKDLEEAQVQDIEMSLLPRLAQSKQTHAPLIGDAIVAKQSSVLGSYSESSSPSQLLWPAVYVTYGPRCGHFLNSCLLFPLFGKRGTCLRSCERLPHGAYGGGYACKNRLSFCMARKRVSAESVEGGNEVRRRSQFIVNQACMISAGSLFLRFLRGASSPC